MTVRLLLPLHRGRADGGFHCDVCGVVTQPQQRIPATGHSPVTDRSVPPTFCTAAGRTEGSHCTVCNAVLVPQVEIPAVGHLRSLPRNPTDLYASGL